MTDPTLTRRWSLLAPIFCLIVLLSLVGVLLLSERFRWFTFNEKKGWTVLIAVASVGIAGILMAFLFVAGLFFRWRFQISIRLLLTLLFVIAIPFEWLAVEKLQAENQKKTLTAIRNAGGYFRYDYQDWAEVVLVESNPSGPDWLRSLVGGNFFDEVTGAEFGDPKINDSVLELVEKLPDLNWLSISGTFEPYRSLIRTQITDAGLEHLSKLTHLKYLFLPGGQITNAGLGHIERLTQLKCLDLWNTKITDVGIEHLKVLRQLVDLDLGRTQITDAGLNSLTDLHELQTLNLQQTKVSDEGVKRLQQALPKCTIQR
jgi:Leucine-rich repeat (LRR) protein